MAVVSLVAVPGCRPPMAEIVQNRKKLISKYMQNNVLRSQ